MTYSFLKELTNAASNDSILDQKIDQLTTIGKVDFFPDYNYKSGKLVGILRYIARNRERDTLCKLFNIPDRFIQIFLKAYGNTPYVTKEGIYQKGNLPDLNTLKQCCHYFGKEILQLELLDEEFDDMEDIERIKIIYENIEKKVLSNVQAQQSLLPINDLGLPLNLVGRPDTDTPWDDV